MKSSFKLAVEQLKGAVIASLAKMRERGVNVSPLESKAASVDIDGDLNEATEQLKHIIKEMGAL